MTMDLLVHRPIEISSSERDLVVVDLSVLIEARRVVRAVKADDDEVIRLQRESNSSRTVP